MKVNSITQDFNLKVQQLINDGTEPEEIQAKLDWGSSPFSLVRNSKRNVPPEKYDLFLKVFEFENDRIKHETYVKSLEAKYIKRLEDDLELTRAHNDVLRDRIDVSLAQLLDNQLVALSLFESAIKIFSEMLLPGDLPRQRQLRSDLHRDAVDRLTVAKRKGRHAEIDTEDIIVERK